MMQLDMCHNLGEQSDFYCCTHMCHVSKSIRVQLLMNKGSKGDKVEKLHAFQT